MVFGLTRVPKVRSFHFIFLVFCVFHKRTFVNPNLTYRYPHPVGIGITPSTGTGTGTGTGIGTSKSTSTMPVQHRGGSLKQSNKAHVGYKGHASKRSLKKKSGGRVLSGKSSHNGSNALDRSRADRRNHSVQLRKAKRVQQLALKRARQYGGPHVVAVVPLAAAADLKSFVQNLITGGQADATGGGGGKTKTGLGLGSQFVSGLGIQTPTSVAGRPVTVEFPNYKKRFMFIEAARNLTAILDVAKVADTVVFVIPVGEPTGMDACCDDLGIATISCLLNQGIGNIIGVLQGLDKLKKSKSKKVAEMKRYGQRVVHTEFGDKAKAIDASQHRMILRALAETPVEELKWRKLRSYFPAQKFTLAKPQVMQPGAPPNAVTDVAVEGCVRA